MQTFFTPDILSKYYQLNEDESRHCIKVLRLRKNDFINLIDGKGGFYKAKIIDPNQKKCIVEIITVYQNYGKRNFCLHIGISPTKSIDRFEWFLEKVTEIGVDEITPLLCDHSERTTIRVERLKKIIISAMKQACQAYEPRLNPMTRFADFINKPKKGQKFITYCLNGKKELLGKCITPHENLTILVGPEGDFSEEEIILAKNSGFVEVSLGSSRLRTETAGVIVCHTSQLINDLYGVDK
jgi:16S rRNA (uracil1498-N3)-methyltransferase